MKTKLLVPLCFVLSLSAFGQAALTPRVIASTGNYATSGTLEVSYTVGELALVSTATSGNITLTQGFHQSEELVTGLLESSKTEFGSMVVYPVPATNEVWYGFEFPEAGKANIHIVNMLGELVTEVPTIEYSQGKYIQQFSTSNLASGKYFIKTEFTGVSGNKSSSTKDLLITK